MLQRLDFPAMTGKEVPEAGAQDNQAADRAGFGMDLGGVAIFGSAAAYALGYAAQDSFFGSFGLTPDQVGVDKLSALLRIVPLAAVFGFGIATLFTAGIGVGKVVHRQLPARFSGRWPLALFVPAVAVLAVAVMSLSNAWPDLPLLDAGVSVLCCWLATAIVWVIFRAVWNGRAASAAAAVVLVIMGTVALYEWIPPGARLLQSSAQAPTRLALIGIRSGWVDVRWHDLRHRPPELAANPPGSAITPPPHTQLPRMLVVVNQSNGVSALWDCVLSRIYTVRDTDADIVRVFPSQGNGADVAAWTGCSRPASAR